MMIHSPVVLVLYFQLPLTSRSAEASPMDGPPDKSPSSRIIFQRSVSEYVHPVRALDDEDDGQDANYRTTTRRRNNSGGVGGKLCDGVQTTTRHRNNSGGVGVSHVTGCKLPHDHVTQTQ